MKSFETWTLEAFVRAVSQADKPLPKDLQGEIHRIGHALENHDFTVIRDIPALVKRDIALYDRFQRFYRNIQQQYQLQERAKSLEIEVNIKSSIPYGYGLESQIAQVLSADDIVGAARQLVSRLDNQLTTNSNQVDVWRRGDHIVALASGGAFLGVLLAQIPGALIGGLIAAVYAWFTAPQTESHRKT